MNYDDWKATDLADDYDEPDYGEDEEDMTPKELLEKAKQVVIDKGWCQHKMRNRKGECCMLGAIDLAADQAGLGEYDFTDNRAADILCKTVPGGRVTRFNDAPERTKDEVLAKFDEAIKLAEEEAV